MPLFIIEKLETGGRDRNMLYLITDADHPSLLKKISCLGSYDLGARLATLLTELGDFNRNIKCNLITFKCHDLSLKNLRQKGGIGTYHI